MNQDELIKLWNEHKHYIIMALNMLVLIYSCYQMYQVGFYNGQIQQCTDLDMERYMVSEPGSKVEIKCLSDEQAKGYEQYDQFGYKENEFDLGYNP